MREHHDTLPSKVTVTDITARVTETVYSVLPGTTTTICHLRMVNGYTVLGTSACVDPTKFNQALGEQYAYEDAIKNCWPLEGYLLAERRFQSTNL